jgi:dolichyl-phosphate beta-glucosyltransferase
MPQNQTNQNNLSVTLVVPCYNEVANLQKGVLDKIGSFAQKNPAFLEVLIVDDGSSDDSRKIVQEYIDEFPKFRLIKNNHQGKAFAIITGIREAKGKQVMFSDIDLATPIEESVKLMDAYKDGAQIVIGSRSSTREGAPITRKIMAFGAIFMRGFFLGLPGVRDTQCGFKLFDSAAAKKIVEMLQVFRNGKTINGSSVSAGFDMEFLFIAHKLGLTIDEIPVVWRHVETKNVHFFNDSLETLRDMARIRYYYLKGMYGIAQT